MFPSTTYWIWYESTFSSVDCFHVALTGPSPLLLSNVTVPFEIIFIATSVQLLVSSLSSTTYSPSAYPPIWIVPSFKSLSWTVYLNVTVGVNSAPTFNFCSRPSSAIVLHLGATMSDVIIFPSLVGFTVMLLFLLGFATPKPTFFIVTVIGITSPTP